MESELQPILDQLDSQGGHIDRMRHYYAGHHPSLTYSTARFREAFGKQLGGLVSNYMDLVVDVISARIVLQGFRFTGQEEPDNAVWTLLWQANRMDSDASLAHTDALVTGRCPIMLWVGADGLPRITIEDARHCLVRYDAGDRRLRRDAVKRWTDNEGHGRASWFLPDEVRLYRTGQPVIRLEDTNNHDSTTNGNLLSTAEWKRIDTVPNPFGAVPVVELRPRPLIDGSALSELEDLTSTQDAVNKLWADMMVASEFGAFKQRWVSGLDVPRDENGQPLQPFAETARLYVSESEGTRFGEFGQADLGVFTTAIQALVDSLSSQAGIPGHLLARVGGQYPSGEALMAAESSLVDKVHRYDQNFGEAYEDLIRMALRLVDDPRASDVSCEVIWKDPGQHTVGSLVDALMKMQALGAPNEVLWGMWGASPQQVQSWKAMGPAAPLPTGP